MNKSKEGMFGVPEISYLPAFMGVVGLAGFYLYKTKKNVIIPLATVRVIRPSYITLLLGGLLTIIYYKGEIQKFISNLVKIPKLALTICPSKYFSSADYGIEQISPNILINGNPVDFDAPYDCCSKIAAINKTYYLVKRPVIYPCQCARSLATACATRMNFNLRDMTPNEIRYYVDTFARILTNNPWTMDNPTAILFQSEEIGGEIRVTPPPDFIQLTMHQWSFNLWLNRFSGVKKERIVKAYNEIMAGNFISDSVKNDTEAFVKKEPYAKGNDEGISPFSPRLIVSFSNYYVATYGPLWYSYTKHLMNVQSIYDDVKDKVLFTIQPDERKYFYLTGYDAQQMGDWYQQALVQANIIKETYQEEDIVHEYGVIIAEEDASKYDGHRARDMKRANFAVLSTVLEDGVTVMESMIAHMDIDVKKNLMGALFRFFTNGTWHSGHLGTSCVNTTDTEIGFDIALRKFVHETRTRLTAIVAVLGDDNLAIIVIAMDFLVRFKEICLEVGASLQQDMTISIHTENLNFPDQPYPAASFCSGYFYLIKLNGEARIIWGPKVTRILFKLFYCKDLTADYDAYVNGLLMAYRHLFPALPFLNVIYSKLRKVISTKKIIKPDDYLITVNQCGYTMHPDAYDMFRFIYGDLFDANALDNYLLNAPIGPLDHPMLTMMVNVDLPVAEEKVVTTPRFPGYFNSNLNYFRFLMDRENLRDLLGLFQNCVSIPDFHANLKGYFATADVNVVAENVVVHQNPLIFNFFFSISCVYPWLLARSTRHWSKVVATVVSVTWVTISKCPDNKLFEILSALWFPVIIEEIIKEQPYGVVCMVSLEAIQSSFMFRAQGNGPIASLCWGFIHRWFLHCVFIGGSMSFSVKRPFWTRVHYHLINNFWAVVVGSLGNMEVAKQMIDNLSLLVQANHAKPFTFLIGVLFAPITFLTFLTDAIGKDKFVEFNINIGSGIGAACFHSWEFIKTEIIYRGLLSSLKYLATLIWGYGQRKILSCLNYPIWDIEKTLGLCIKSCFGVMPSWLRSGCS
jgi:hypothetical protein